MKDQTLKSHLDPLGLPPVGRWLKAQRDVLGYSLSQASEMTQMSERTLQLLESERFLELFDSCLLIQQAQDHRLNSHMVSSAAARNVRPGYFTVGAIFMLNKISMHTSQANHTFDQFIRNKAGHTIGSPQNHHAG